MVVRPALWGAAQAAEGVGEPHWNSVDNTESVCILLNPLIGKELLSSRKQVEHTNPSYKEKILYSLQTLHFMAFKIKVLVTR